MSHDTALKRPALYNPALWSRNEVRTYYVARHNLLARFLDDFRREKAGTRPQHRLILGQRGMGKSTLLRRLAIGVEDDPELAAQWLPLIFPEEQYNVATLADFWLNCLDALGDSLEARGDVVEVKALDAEVERLDHKDGECALQALLRMARKLDRRLLLLVDNIDLVLGRIKDKDWVLREALQQHPELLLVGASSRALESTYDYGAAFYDFFRIDELRGLTEDEMRDTIVALARERGADDVVDRVQSNPGRLRVLHTLTGGNPRTAVLLYGVLLKGVDGDVRSDLEALLDEVTPLYKARFDELPTQAQQLLDKLALHWDPMSARQAADALGWTVNLASAQLDRLVQSGVAEKVKAGSGKRIAFQVAERFFNIWYLMRASRRLRRKLMWLVEFLRVFFSSEELQSLARDSLQATSADARSAEYMLALCRAIGPMPVVRALEARALEAVLSTRGAVLDEIFDMSGDDSDLASKAEQIKARKAARAILERMFAGEQDKGVIEQILGLPLPLEILLKLVGAFDGTLSTDRERLQQLVERVVQKSTLLFGALGYSWLSSAIANGYMESPRDLEGGEAAALRFECPLLEIVPRLLIHPTNAQEGAELERLAREAIGFDPSGALYWICLAEALIAQDRIDGALDVARKARAIAPEDPDILFRVGAVFEKSPETLAEAEAVYRKVLAFEPENPRALRALILLWAQDVSSLLEAVPLAQQLCALEPNDPSNWILLAGTLRAEKGREEESLTAARRAVELAPNDPGPLAVLTVLLLAMTRIDEAAVEARKLFDRLGTKDELLDQEAKLLIPLLSIWCRKDAVPLLLREMDATDAAQRFRPAREALAAVVAGSSDVLNGVAPEVRKPALEILAIIAPKLVNPETLAAPI